MLLQFATYLIGEKDAQTWWDENQDIFAHPRFYVPVDRNDRVYFHSLSVARAMEKCNYTNRTVWAHPHPDLDHSFGVYIVRDGDRIIYQGPDETVVRDYLRVSAKL